MISKTRTRKVIKELSELKEIVKSGEEENKKLSDELKILEDKIKKIEDDIKKLKK